MKRITDDIAGRFTRVSRTTYHNGTVLVAFCGSLYPHDLKTEQISYIKTFYNMPNAEHEFFNEWPGEIEPAYAAAKANYKNGYLLLTVGPAT